jgi:hypothetical protein
MPIWSVCRVCRVGWLVFLLPPLLRRVAAKRVVACLVGLLCFCVVCVVCLVGFGFGRGGEVVVTVVCYVLLWAGVVFGCGLWSSYLGRVFFAGTVPRSSLLTLLG